MNENLSRGTNVFHILFGVGVLSGYRGLEGLKAPTRHKSLESLLNFRLTNR